MSVAFMTESGEIVDRDPDAFVREQAEASEPPAPRRTVREAERASKRPARVKRERAPRAPGSRWRVAFWVLLALTLLSHSAPGASDPASIPVSAFPVCETEDSDACFWDASERGNGQGASFVSLGGAIHPVAP